jgi:hypothetical protein
LVVVPVPTVGDGARVEVVMTKRIGAKEQRQLPANVGRRAASRSGDL